MRAWRCQRLLAALCLAAWMTLHHAAAQPSSQPVQPTLGQDGKDAIWVPTPHHLVEKMLDLARVTAGDIVVDLGSGDGRTVIAAAKRGATARGIEYNGDLVALSKLNAAREGVSDKTTFEQADIFVTDFSNADVVALFLLPALNERLRPIILNMKPGTRVVSNTFEMGTWFPDKVVDVWQECDFFFCKALLWIVPAKIQGNWTMQRDQHPGELLLQQTFQTFTGLIRNGAVATPVTNGKLNGNEIRFTAGGVEYTGKVRGETMEGTTVSGAKWHARRAP